LIDNNLTNLEENNNSIKNTSNNNIIPTSSTSTSKDTNFSTNSIVKSIEIKLRILLKFYAIKGYSFIILGMAINILWILPLSYIEQDIIYNPNIILD
jgi:hypothetical protein